MRQSRRHIICLLAAAFLMSLLPACTSDAPLQDNNDSNDKFIWLSFYFGFEAHENVSLTRAEYDICTHNEEDDTPEERYISPQDLTILLLDDKDKRCFHTISGSSHIFLSKITDSENNNGYYQTVCQLSYDNLSPIDNDQFFYILVIANSQGTNGGNPKFEGDFIGKTINEIADLKKTFSISGAIWSPNGNNNRIPMSGLAKVKTPTTIEISLANFIRPHILTDTEGKPLEINMLRSMCKIRFIDQISNNDEYPASEHPLLNNISIKSITLQGHETDRSGFNKQGTFIPNWRALEAWLDNEKTTICNYCAHPTYVEEWSGGNRKIELQKKTNSSNSTQFVAYIPENVLIDGGVWSKHRQPKVFITTQTVIDGATFEKEWELNLNEILVNQDMVRNHIYEFKILMKPAENMLQVNYTVCKWNEGTTNIEFN